jgi:isopentenyldiphosphate isomerase
MDSINTIIKITTTTTIITNKEVVTTRREATRRTDSRVVPSLSRTNSMPKINYRTTATPRRSNQEICSINLATTMEAASKEITPITTEIKVRTEVMMANLKPTMMGNSFKISPSLEALLSTVRGSKIQREGEITMEESNLIFYPFSPKNIFLNVLRYLWPKKPV